MDTILDCACDSNRIVAYPYLDTTELFFRFLNKDGYHALVKLARIEPVQHHHRLMGYRVILNQPPKAKLLKLDKLARIHHGVLSRFDLAVDMQSDNPEELRNAILSQGVLNWRRQQPMRDDDRTVYWVDFKLKARKPRAYRNLILYDDKHNKITGEVDCVHLELRFVRAAMVKRQGVHTVKDLLKINPRTLFHKHVKFTDIAERYVAKRVREETTRQRKNYRGKEVTANTDHYHAHIPGRVRGLLHRLGCDRAQNVRYQVNRVSSESGVDLDIPERLEWCSEERIPRIENIGEFVKGGSNW
jgi:hypothetical protein